MSKNILIFSDGTGQAGGLRPEQRLSNIYKLYRSSKVGPDNPIDPDKQVAFYDPGLGTNEVDDDFFLLRIYKKAKNILSQALGGGINTNIVDCYEAILKHYEPGDRIYLFGFSRGAYTVRCVASTMNLCGVPTHDEEGRPLPKFGKKLRKIAEEAVYKVYEHGAGKNRGGRYFAEREEQARRFREKYGSEGTGLDDESQGNIQPYFIGVFDTVAALGVSKIQKFSFILLPSLLALTALWSIFIAKHSAVYGVSYLVLFVISWLYVGYTRLRYIKDFPNTGKHRFHFKSWRLTNYDKSLDNLVPYARHAIAIDENRENFPHVGWGRRIDYERLMNQKPAWLKQVWFAGNHSDIGGSYPEAESRLSDIALHWMIEQVEEVEHPIILNKNLLNCYPKHDAMQHCEIKSMKDKLFFSWPKKRRTPHVEVELHPTVLERFKCDAISDYGESALYRPEALRNHIKVKHYY